MKMILILRRDFNGLKAELEKQLAKESELNKRIIRILIKIEIPEESKLKIC